MFDSVFELRSAVARCATGFDPDVLDADTAARAVREWAAIEHMAATAKALAAARAAAGSVWKTAGAPTAADWLARETGTTAARAREQLDTAERLRGLDAVAAAAQSGELSPAQAAVIADAATADPAAEGRLLEAAGRESLGELRDRAARTKAAADPDPDATHRRIHAARGMRRWQSGDGVAHLHASGPPEAVARLDSALRPEIERHFAAARAEGRREPHEAYAFDALIALADRSVTAPAPTATRSRTRYRAVVRADLEALVRGSIEGDETCEIAGLGPIPVSIARALLGESSLHLVLTKGVDVANVTYLGRGPSAAQSIALLWQMPICSSLGCNRRARLEVDHRNPFAENPVTELSNLDHLCEHDHDLKTNQGWALVAGTGKRLFVPPDHPDHPRQAARGSPIDVGAG